MSDSQAAKAALHKRSGGQADLIRGPIVPSILLFAAALFGSLLFQQLYNTMDTVIVGHLLGDSALAAMGSAGVIYDLLTGFAFGMGNGMAIVTARFFGNGDMDGVKKTAAAAIIIGICLTLILTLGSYFFLEDFLRVLNTPEEIIGQAYSYISLIVLFIGVMFAYNLCSAILRAIGNSLAPLCFLIFSSLLNIALDIFAISVLDMGIRGAAAATIIAQAISVILCLIYIIARVRLLVPEQKHFRPEAAMYKDMLSQGLAMGFMSCIVMAGTATLQSGINTLGTQIIAGHTTARKIFLFLLMPIHALSQTTGPYVSQNYGADQRDRILRGIRAMYIMVWIICGLVTVSMLLWARPLVSLISGSTEAVLVDNASAYLRFAGPFFGVLGMLNISRTALQGLNSKLLPVVSSVIELIGKIIFALVFVPRFGYPAVIVCEPVIWLFMTAELLWALRRNPYLRGIEAGAHTNPIHDPGQR